MTNTRHSAPVSKLPCVTVCGGGGKTEKGLEGIEKSLLKKKSSLAKTRPNFIVRVSPCECESSLRLLPRVVNKICYRIKHACFHSSSHSPRFPSVFLFQSVGDRAFSDAHESGATPSFTTLPPGQTDTHHCFKVKKWGLTHTHTHTAKENLSFCLRRLGVPPDPH